MNYTYGYIRVSADDQSIATQLDTLRGENCARIFQEKVTGRRTSSEALDELLALLRPGDMVVVNRLARLGRNAIHTLGLIKLFLEKGVLLRAINANMDTSTPAGRLMAGMLLLVAEFELDDNREKSLHGIALAKAAGKHMGRRPGRDEAKVAKVRKAFDNNLSVPDIVSLTGISKASVYRYQAEYDAEKLRNATKKLQKEE